jgi:hypothetical protein
MTDEVRRKRREDEARSAQRTRTLNSFEELCGAPPPYSLAAPSTVPAPSTGSTKSTPTTDIAFENLDFTPNPLELPTPTECIAHLKLLHAFAKLRHDVGNRNGLFGIDYTPFDDVSEIAGPPVG